jgi:hypothetical protein
MFPISRRSVAGVLAALAMSTAVALPAAAADDDKPLTPEAILAKKFEGQATAEFVVGKAGQLFEARSIQPDESEAIYLAPTVDGKTGSRVYVILSWQVATRLRKLGIDDPSGHFQGKLLRVSGAVKQLTGDNLPKSRLLFWARGQYKSETVTSGTEPEYFISVTSLDQLVLVRKP